MFHHFFVRLVLNFAFLLSVPSLLFSVDAILELKPVSVDSAPVKHLKIKGIFPDRAESSFFLEAQGLFGLASGIVVGAQRSLTYLLSDSISEREPTDKEREGLETLVNSVLAELAQIAE